LFFKRRVQGREHFVLAGVRGDARREQRRELLAKRGRVERLVDAVEVERGQRVGHVLRGGAGRRRNLARARDGLEALGALAGDVCGEALDRIDRCRALAERGADVAMTRSLSGRSWMPRRARRRRMRNATSAPLAPRYMCASSRTSRSCVPSWSSHRFVSAKTGRSNGRISMYSSIE
jgi:hypothetical protein